MVWRFHVTLCIALWVLAAAAIGFAFNGPIAVPPEYYAFVDNRVWCGVPNAGDVFTNAPFAVVGLWGVWRIHAKRHDIQRKPGMYPGLLLFFVFVFLVAFGSAQFHLDPGEDTVMLDRAPISLAAGCILAVFLIDRLPLKPAHAMAVLWASLAFAVAGLVHVSLTGDVRLYALTQLAPIFVGLACAARPATVTPLLASRYVLAMVALYVGAKLVEMLDAEIYDALVVASGHNLKHLLAAAAALMPALIARRP